MTGIIDILYVRFAVPDLAAQAEFLENFGMHVARDDGVIYARGTDPRPFIYSAVQGEPAFLGLGIEAESEAALRQIAAIDDAAVTENTAPGEGLIVQLADPDGFRVEVVWGFMNPSKLDVPSRSPLNDGEARPRQGERVQFEDQAQTIKRLGHCVLAVSDFRRSEAWYKERFGFITSDEVYAGAQDNALGAFMRCDRGEEHVDHHTLFLLGAGEPDFNHAAFEIANWDTLMAGHYALQEKGYQHSWGVGKHILGSQVFDYWKDPHGFTLEHFTDGDLLNAEFGSHRAPVEQLLGSHWGPAGSPT
jgi:catechol 2,3-dioxygenase-like lactoylglutathione lyase family enzyme